MERLERTSVFLAYCQSRVCDTTRASFDKAVRWSKADVKITSLRPFDWKYARSRDFIGWQQINVESAQVRLREEAGPNTISISLRRSRHNQIINTAFVICAEQTAASRQFASLTEALAIWKSGHVIGHVMLRPFSHDVRDKTISSRSLLTHSV